jgi:hypothetical protein
VYNYRYQPPPIIYQQDPQRMFWLYFVRPFQRLLYEWPAKTLSAVVLTTIWTLLEHAVGVYQQLLGLPLSLIVLATIAFFGDLASALLAAYRRDGVAGFDHLKFRQLGLKAAYWIIVISVFSALASAAETHGVPFLAEADVACVFYLTVQDAHSIIANWKGSENGARRWFQGMLSLSNGSNPLHKVLETSDSSEKDGTAEANQNM